MRILVLCLLLLAACGSKPPSVTQPAEPGAQAPEPARPGPDDGSSHAPDIIQDIALGTLDGAESSLGAYRAPVTVLALWASYCAPCLRELHRIEALHRRYRDRDEVTVLLVSIDEFDADSRATVARILEQRAMTVPAFIDHQHALIERVAPRDRQGKPYYAVPMLVVVDEQFRLRRRLDLGHGHDEETFVADVSALVDAALRGEEAAPEQPYEAPLGSGFTAKRTITLTVEKLEANQIVHYVRNLRRQIHGMYPDLHDQQLDELMVEIEAKLHRGGTFTVEIPPARAGGR